MRLAARAGRGAAAGADGLGHAPRHGNERARAARAQQLAGLRAVQAPGGVRVLRVFIEARRDGDGAERREVGAVEAALDDQPLNLCHF
jgi:hypothetical protein